MSSVNLRNGLAIGFKLFLMLLLFFFVTDVWGEVDEKAVKILERTSAYYQALENFRAVYSLTVHYPELEESIVQSSKMVITVRGQQYRLACFQQETITDGETIWVHDKEIKEVTISNYATTDNSLNFVDLPNIYQQGGYEPIYVREHIVNRKKNKIEDVVQLIPAEDNSDSNFKSILLEIDRATAQICGWEIIQNEEVKYRCKLSSFAANIELSDDCFTFDINAHGLLEVIDLRENENLDDFLDLNLADE